ncbi:MAG TPA: hypothetical protein VJ957_07795 [Longimicrobiales bacterium]|nr:hypothetical protein [Longimicrobiales bacterium]
MIGALMKTYAYAKAPRTMFALRHPRAAGRLVKLRWDLKHATAPRVAAAGAAAGAVVLALPLGLLLGRLSAGNGEAAE